MLNRPIITDHAKSNMARRAVTEAHVREALAASDITYPGSNKDRETMVKEGLCQDGRRLCVVVDKKKPRVVVTAYWRT